MFGSVKCIPRCGEAIPHFLRFFSGISIPGAFKRSIKANQSSPRYKEQES